MNKKNEIKCRRDGKVTHDDFLGPREYNVEIDVFQLVGWVE